VPRPPKCRRVEFKPEFTYFKPAGIPKHQLQELVLHIEEIEAIRLKDREGLEQADCAEKMQVSRPTFQRILMSARSKLAQAIIEGKAIKIEGGNFCIPEKKQFICSSCEHQFEKTLTTCDRSEVRCPKCKYFSQKVQDKPLEEE